jgi:coproporphyrinogen III oxidase-like Fe-S oxidoreductase
MLKSLFSKRLSNRTQNRSISVYVHWYIFFSHTFVISFRPYCSSICPYCDFNKYIVPNVDEERMKRSLLRELENGLKMVPDLDPVVSVILPLCYERDR